MKRALLVAVLVPPVHAAAALSAEQVADARAAIIIEISDQDLAGRVRLSASLEACNNAPLARAVSLAGPERVALVRAGIDAVAASRRPIATTLRTLGPADKAALTELALVDVVMYQVGYMNGMVAWKLSSPEICRSFADAALRILRK